LLLDRLLEVGRETSVGRGPELEERVEEGAQGLRDLAGLLGGDAVLGLVDVEPAHPADDQAPDQHDQAEQSHER
jgi:hypothetical protein